MDIEFPVILLAGFHRKINPMAVCGISDNEIDWIGSSPGHDGRVEQQDRIEGFDMSGMAFTWVTGRQIFVHCWVVGPARLL